MTTRQILFLYFTSSSTALITSPTLSFSDSFITQLKSKSISSLPQVTSTKLSKVSVPPKISTTNVEAPFTLDGYISLRLAMREDVPSIYQCNLATSSEISPPNDYINQLKRWPELALVAEHIPRTRNSEEDPTIVGYAFGKVVRGFHPYIRHTDMLKNESESSIVQPNTVSLSKHRGHVTSIAILPAYRRRGLAELLMKQLDYQMSNGYVVNHVGLNVRINNEAAKMLYCNKLGYSTCNVVPHYYSDDEDALFLHKTLDGSLEDKLTRCGLDRGGAIKHKKVESVVGIRHLNYEMKSFWDKSIGKSVRSYWGKKIENDDSSLWLNGRTEFRLPRKYSLTVDGLS